MRPILLASALLALSACGEDQMSPVPPPAVADDNAFGSKIRPEYIDFEMPGPNLWFFCDGQMGVYMTEGSNGDSGKSAAPFVVPNHPRCRG